ncbi:hypothetical protein [Streptomyces corynorhini]|uniref:hypothetical protein n=1 Tax=Streptomyces corynorhini TaxID=2282652 RepID=UPI00389AD484
MGRRPLAWVAAIVLLLEGVGAVLLNGVLATVVGNQRMSLAGVDPGSMVAGTWAMGGILGLYLVLCAAVLVRTALKDRAPGLVGRIALITCAVTHGVLATLAVGLVGWDAFAFMMVVVGLLVLILLGYGTEPGRRPAAPA